MEDNTDLYIIKDTLRQASERLLKHPNVNQFDIWWIRTMLAREMKFILSENEYWRLITTHTDLVRTTAEQYAWDLVKQKSEKPLGSVP